MLTIVKKYTIRYFVAFLFFLMANPTLAAEDPVEMLQKVTQNVIIKLKKNSQTLKHEPKYVYSIIDNVVLPHIDFSQMARWVVGRNAWYNADNSTRILFVDEFKTYVVKNYIHFLVKFSNEKIKFFPLRAGIKNKRDIQVSSQIQREGESPIRMDYRLILQEDAWKVYDIVIEGVSMLEGYQAQFSDAIKEGGVPAVIDKIQRYNVM